MNLRPTVCRVCAKHGTTSEGGAANCGTVFCLTLAGAYTVLLTTSSTPGAVFRIGRNTRAFAALHDFDPTGALGTW